MITLTTPVQIDTVLGGNTKVGYNHLVLAPFTMDPFARTISGRVRLTSTTNPEMDVIFGTFDIALGPGTLIFKVEQFDMVRRIALSGAQVSAIQTVLTNAQNALESGLISVGVVAGTQSPGA